LYAEKDKLPAGLNLGDSLNSESIYKLKEIIGMIIDISVLGLWSMVYLTCLLQEIESKLCGMMRTCQLNKYFHDLATKD